MRVRVLRDFTTMSATFEAGRVVDIDPKRAEPWLRAGLVEEDKSLDGARETKEADGMYLCSKCGRRHKNESDLGRRHLEHKKASGGER